MNADKGYIYWMDLVMQHYGESAFETIRHMNEQITELETVSGISVDNIIDLFKKGYRLEEPTDIMKEFEHQMGIIALEQENKELRRKNKKLRNRIFKLQFGYNRRK